MSVVGWSLGGIYAREIAHEYPGSVRQVVTLGSPIQMVDGDGSATSGAWQSLHHLYDERMIDRSVPTAEHQRLPVPSTAVYTRTDGIVHWRTCLERPGPEAENVEVRGSHCGLGFNAAVALVVADRLAQPDGHWRPFRAPRWIRGAFPPPATWRPRPVRRVT